MKLNVPTYDRFQTSLPVKAGDWTTPVVSRWPPFGLRDRSSSLDKRPVTSLMVLSATVMPGSRLPVASLLRAVIVSVALAAPGARAQTAGALEPIQYTFRVIDADKHLAGVAARVPTDGHPTITLMMPVWTPGYYVIEDYAARV